MLKKLPEHKVAPSSGIEICYPEVFRFTNKSTYWGCEHESNARECMLKQWQNGMRNFQ